MAHLIGSARVFADDQALDLQRDALTAAGCARVFEEIAHGACAARPKLDAALGQVLAGDTLVVWRLDRLGRSLPHLIETIGQLRERDIGFQVADRRNRHHTAAGELVFQLFDSLAQFERRLTVERTHAGLTAARGRGRVAGRPPKMTVAKLNAARSLLASEPRPSLGEVAEAIGVERTTLSRHLAASDIQARLRPA